MWCRELLGAIDIILEKLMFKVKSKNSKINIIKQAKTLTSAARKLHIMHFTNITVSTQELDYDWSVCMAPKCYSEGI